MNNTALVNTLLGAIKADNEALALTEFNNLLNSVADHSSYKDWTEQWIESIYELGRLFSNRNPKPYLDTLKTFSNQNEFKRETADFIYSEIIWNYFSEDRAFVKDELKDLKQKYPTNPEFYHSYSHILEINGNYEDSFQILEQAIKIDPCSRFVDTYINRIRNIFNKYIASGSVKSAEKILRQGQMTFNSMSNKARYSVYTNIMAQLTDRLNDHKIIYEKILNIDNIILKRTEALRNRFVSMLGVFAAIIAFILTTVNIAISNLGIKEMMLLMLTMADILIIFTISIDYVFRIRRTSKNLFEFLGDKQFLGIAVLLILLYWLYTSI